jgi:light-regulated signal transduction histidine kinase (bacteriophytochrome)
VLLEDYSSCLDEDASGILAKIRSETQRMGNLIDTLITLSKVTRAGMNLEPIDLSQIARGVCTRMMEFHPERQGEIIIQPDLKAYADDRLMEIVLENLLSNALKFSSKTLNPQIEFGKIVQNGVDTFFIRDNGAGFEMKYANKLFGTFQRLHKSTEFPGIGIGLAMVKRIIERHGGRIWAESEPDQYTIFYFNLREKS